MNKSFAAAAETLAAQGPEGGIAKLLRTAGATMARAAPSTMGTLTASGFLRASKALEGSVELGTAEIATFWAAFRDAIAERGKAKVGDKTILDVLAPITISLEEQARQSTPLSTALAATAVVAADALEKTKDLLAQHGKAAAFQQRTIGLQDAGTTLECFLVGRVAEFVNDHQTDASCEFPLLVPMMIHNTMKVTFNRRWL